MSFSFATCEVELLRSSVGEVNIGGPVFGLQQQLNSIILPALIVYVNSLGAEGFLFPSLQGFSAVNAVPTLPPLAVLCPSVLECCTIDILIPTVATFMQGATYINYMTSCIY